MSDNEKSHWESKWAYRLAGVGVVVGIFWGFFKSDGNILEALAGGLLGAIVFGLLGMPISLALSLASDQTTPFKQGLTFTTGIAAGLALLDLLLLQGMLVIKPSLTMLFGGDWANTYWGCREYWRCVEEGCFCNRTD